MQEVPIDTREIGEIFQKFYPDLEKILKNLAKQK